VWVKKSPPLGDLTFFHFFHKRLRICNRFFTHLLNVPIFAKLQIFIQLSPILMKLCHIKRDYPVHIICAKCPKRAKMHAFRRLCKSLIALLIVVCGKSLYTVFRKKHPLTFSFISPWMVCKFKQKLQWIYARNGRFWQCRNYIFIAADDVIMTSY